MYLSAGPTSHTRNTPPATHPRFDLFCAAYYPFPYRLPPSFIRPSHFAALGTQLQWPRGGPQAIADALVDGLRAHGGKLMLNSPVDSVVQGRGGRAAGVVLRGGLQVCI
jgi:phytoene dehydrogenase-like protein